ncbi:inorganic diphosphatase [uncultured Jannaschia sp.]|uniref:inorganic diphosphatase n=1 Tax=uncultured Jannaschia sp. TaxID=293347 RepID=UPI00261DFCEF|nr:inorganic diphosphatase [uncultured Jannaschia sp.]
MFHDALKSVPSRTEAGDINVFIETPMGSQHKYELDPSGLFKIALSLPDGMRFPFGFGFVPGTEAGDGDPLDILLLTDGPVPAGFLIDARLIGVLKMENEEDGEMVRNDRIVAVAKLSRIFSDYDDLEQMRSGFAWDMERFFKTYNAMIERRFEVIGRGNRSDARKMLEDAGR